MKIKKNNIPSLRISTSSACNCRCSFCQVDGDFCSDFAYIEPKSDKQLSQFFTNIISIFWHHGVRHFSLTGGEPLLNSRVTFKVAEYIRGLFLNFITENNEGYLRLNTNGILIKDHFKQIHKYFDLIKISLVSIDKENFYRITSTNRLNDVLLGIKLLDQLCHPIRIQTVVIKENLHEIFELIKFCEEYKSIKEIKFFDLSQYSELWRGDICSSVFWNQQFIDIGILEEKLKKSSKFIRKVYSVGGYGNSMNIYKLESGLTLRFRNSRTSANYGKDCRFCKANQFCRDGHCNLEVGPNEVIKVCRPKEGKIFHPGSEKNSIEYFAKTERINHI